LQRTIDWNASMKNLVPEVLDEIRQRYESKYDLCGLDTGFSDINHFTGGLRPGTLTILGGRPSMGKTAFILNIVGKIAVELNHPTLIITTAESREQYLERLIRTHAITDTNRLRTCTMLDGDWKQLHAEGEKVMAAPLVIEDRGLTIEEIHQSCRQGIDNGFKLELLVIDDLQSLASSGGYLDPREERATVTTRLKRLAANFNIAVLATSQLSRALEERENKRPVLSDLRIEAIDGDAADLVMFLYRDEYYEPETEYRGQAEIIVAKQRLGPIGCIELFYKNSTARFSDKSQRCIGDDD
jgi:replicative DNA helicase